jgi:hypothetical protein
MTDKKKTRTPLSAKSPTARAPRSKPAAKSASPRAKPTPKTDARSALAAPKTKQKLVRDSFTIPKNEYAVLEGLKGRATHLRRPTKKSELLRAGVAALHAMSDSAFLAALDGIPSLKTGRPKGVAKSAVTGG